MVHIKKPNWNDSLINVISSIAKAFGTKSNYQTNALVDQVLAKDYKNIVLLLLDGLGDENLQELSPHGILTNHKKAVISSTFPSTTVAATTTIESGVSPLEHGWLGWSLYFKEIDRNIDIFPYRDSITKELIPLTDFDAKDVLKYETIYQKMSRTTKDKAMFYVFHPDKISHQAEGCTNIEYSDIQNMFDKMKEVCAQEGKKYIYAYSANPDYDMHEFGSRAAEVQKDVLDIETKLEAFVEEVKDTVIIAIADHGHIDIDWIYLAEIPGMKECLAKFPTVESRAKNIALVKGKEEQFLQLYHQYLAQDFLLLSKETLLKEHYFGYGIKHDKFDDFIDDYMLVAIGNKALGFESPKEGEFNMKSTHAGLTAREMLVPLIIIEKKEKENEKTY